MILRLNFAPESLFAQDWMPVLAQDLQWKIEVLCRFSLKTTVCFRKSFISTALNIKDRHRGRQSFTNREFWENLCETHASRRKILSLRRSPRDVIKSRKLLVYRGKFRKENRDSILMDWIPENL